MKSNEKKGDSVLSIDGKPFEIPLEGSLGLLALGATGVLAWRRKREASGYRIQNTNIVQPKSDTNMENTDE